MVKTGPNFKLSKTVKRTIALMKGATAEQRNQYKRMMIDAEYSASIVPKTVKHERNDRKEGSKYAITSDSAVAIE